MSSALGRGETVAIPGECAEPVDAIELLRIAPQLGIHGVFVQSCRNRRGRLLSSYEIPSSPRKTATCEFGSIVATKNSTLKIIDVRKSNSAKELENPVGDLVLFRELC